jgi:putative sterol carrier protein
MENLSIDDFMSQIPSALRPDKASGVNAVIAFHLTGEQGGDWTITIRDQQCTVEKKVAVNPRMTLTATSKDCMDVLTGKLDGMRAFMQGKLRVSGDTGLAMKMTSLFKIS